MAIFGVGSDYKNIITIYADGVPVDADGAEAQFDIMLTFYTTSISKAKTASRIDGVLTNCYYEVVDNIKRIVCVFDDVEWGAGDVICKISYIYADANFPDGKKTVVQYVLTNDSYGKLG